MAVSHRLGALAKFIAEGGGGEWAITSCFTKIIAWSTKPYLEPPLALRSTEAKTVGDVAFDPALFMQVALEDSDAEGNAYNVAASTSCAIEAGHDDKGALFWRCFFTG